MQQRRSRIPILKPSKQRVKYDMLVGACFCLGIQLQSRADGCEYCVDGVQDRHMEILYNNLDFSTHAGKLR